MLKQGTLLRELQSIVGKKHAHKPKNDRDGAVDAMLPQVIIEPGTCEEVAEVLRFANAERLAIIPRGSGLQIGLGNIPTRYDIALSLARLDRIVEHEPADLTVTCQAGITVGALANQVAASRQMVPLALDPDPEDRRTVGGLLSLNMSDERAAYGSPRDFTIGLRVLTTDGWTSKAGGKVVKNVAGYDLCKLYIGSYGTLAVIAEATFKLYPRPEAQETSSFEFANCADACTVTRELHAQALSVVGAQVFRPAVAAENGDIQMVGYVLHLTFAGPATAVERSRRKAESLATLAGAEEFDWSRQRGTSALHLGPQSAGPPLSVRAHLLPTKVPEFIRAVESEANFLFDAAPLLGNVMCVCFDSDQKRFLGRLRRAASALNGALVVEFCSPDLKREIDVFGPPPPSFPLMRAIKQQFDPNNVLSPGRFVGRL